MRVLPQPQLVNALCLTGLGLPFEAYKAVLIVTSQKTLPVAITVISFLDPEQVGSPGLVSIPPILSHLTQIIIDSVLVARCEQPQPHREGLPQGWWGLHMCRV